jgi:hypothetical protein
VLLSALDGRVIGMLQATLTDSLQHLFRIRLTSLIPSSECELDSSIKFSKSVEGTLITLETIIVLNAGISVF